MQKKLNLYLKAKENNYTNKYRVFKSKIVKNYCLR